MIVSLLIAFCISLLLITVIWVVVAVSKNATLVDLAWTLTIGLLAGVYLIIGPGFVQRKLLAFGMTAVWCGRLAFFLWFTRLRQGDEDPRYTAIQHKWGGRWSVKFFLFLQMQAVCAWFFSIPMCFMSFDTAVGIRILEYCGLAIVLCGVAGEAAADYQLYVFKEDPLHKGKTCRFGLWQYSRHPNYFFEWIIWIGFAVAAVCSPYGVIAIMCPMLMIVFLLFITGIPATEARALQTRGDDYRRYQATTSAFIPWFNRKEKNSNAMV